LPFRFTCSRCGATLLECGEEILRYQTSRNAQKTPEPPIEAFIRRKIGVRCPKCGKKLSPKPLSIEIFPIKTVKKFKG
jgi:predicted RNA-binding Zn-ribbon protein involved in translation (DUF1610 family)